MRTLYVVLISRQNKTIIPGIAVKPTTMPITTQLLTPPSGSLLQLAPVSVPTDPYMLWGCALAGLVGLLLLIYVPIRSMQQPRKGLLYVLWLLVATPLYLVNPYNKGGTLCGVLTISLCALFVLDRVVTRGPLAQPRGAGRQEKRSQAPARTPMWDEWVLGWAYSRVWNPERGEYRMVQQSTPCYLSRDQVRTSMLIVAPPGSGKTSSFLKPMLGWIKRIEATAIYLDAKGNDFSASQFDYNFDLAGSNAAPGTPGAPGTQSLPLYVWSGDSLEQAAERLAEALIPSGDEETQYFSDNAKITLRVLAVAYHMATERRPSLQQLLNLLDTGGEDWTDLWQTLERIAPGSQALKDLARVEQLARMKSDPLGKLYNALAPLCTGRAGALMSANPEGAIDLESLLRTPGKRVRFGLPHGLYPNASLSIARLVLAQFRYAVISPTANTAHLKVMACDEAHLFITPDIAKGIAMTRSNNGAYVLALQSLSQIEDPSMRETVVASAGVKVVMSGVADADAEKFSRLWGRMEHQYVSHSVGTSRGYMHGSGTNTANNTSWAAAGAGAYGGHGGGGGGGVSQGHGSSSGISYNQTDTTSTSYTMRPIWLEREIREVGQWHCIIEARDYMGSMEPVTAVHLDRSLTEVIPLVQERKRLLESGVWEPVREPHKGGELAVPVGNGNGTQPKARRLVVERLASLEELGSQYNAALDWQERLKNEKTSPLRIRTWRQHRREKAQAKTYLQQLGSELNSLEITPSHIWTISRVRHDLASLKGCAS